jgi:hypothetical protein
MDSWLELLGAEHNRMAELTTCAVLLICLLFLITIGSTNRWIWLVPMAGIGIVQFLLVCRHFTGCPDGALSIDELMHSIRAECDEMTRQTPYVSFYLATSQRDPESMRYPDYIGVSIALLTHVSGDASVPEVFTRGVDCDAGSCLVMW